MSCHICGGSYKGLAGDCACTNYGVEPDQRVGPTPPSEEAEMLRLVLERFTGDDIYPAFLREVAKAALTRSPSLRRAAGVPPPDARQIITDTGVIVSVERYNAFLAWEQRTPIPVAEIESTRDELVERILLRMAETCEATTIFYLQDKVRWLAELALGGVPPADKEGS